MSFLSSMVGYNFVNINHKIIWTPNLPNRKSVWINTPKEERAYATGALFLLKLSGNQIMYKNLITQSDRSHDFVEYQLQKYYNF